MLCLLAVVGLVGADACSCSQSVSESYGKPNSHRTTRPAQCGSRIHTLCVNELPSARAESWFGCIRIVYTISYLNVNIFCACTRREGTSLLTSQRMHPANEPVAVAMRSFDFQRIAGPLAKYQLLSRARELEARLHLHCAGTRVHLIITA